MHWGRAGGQRRGRWTCFIDCASHQHQRVTLHIDATQVVCKRPDFVNGHPTPRCSVVIARWPIDSDTLHLRLKRNTVDRAPVAGSSHWRIGAAAAAAALPGLLISPRTRIKLKSAASDAGDSTSSEPGCAKVKQRTHSIPVRSAGPCVGSESSLEPRNSEGEKGEPHCRRASVSACLLVLVLVCPPSPLTYVTGHCTWWWWPL